VILEKSHDLGKLLVMRRSLYGAAVSMILLKAVALVIMAAGMTSTKRPLCHGDKAAEAGRINGEEASDRD
jgi:hypothetical protein